VRLTGYETTTAGRTPLKKLTRWLAAIAFVGMLSGPIGYNEVHPLIFGMPFPLGWVTVCVVLTAIIMAIIFSLDPTNREEDQS
jgi:hypothetical protein